MRRIGSALAPLSKSKTEKEEEGRKRRSKNIGAAITDIPYNLTASIASIPYRVMAVGDVITSDKYNQEASKILGRQE